MQITRIAPAEGAVKGRLQNGGPGNGSVYNTVLAGRMATFQLHPDIEEMVLTEEQIRSKVGLCLSIC